MTEYELTELNATAASLTMRAVSIYLPLVSAYLIAAFTTGAKLNRSQAITVSTLFVFGSGLFAYTAVANLKKQMWGIEQLKEISRQDYYFSDTTVLLLGIFLFAGIIASLKFMWDIRHPKTE